MISSSRSRSPSTCLSAASLSKTFALGEFTADVASAVAIVLGVVTGSTGGKGPAGGVECGACALTRFLLQVRLSYPASNCFVVTIAPRRASCPAACSAQLHAAIERSESHQEAPTAGLALPNALKSPVVGNAHAHLAVHSNR